MSDARSPSFALTAPGRIIDVDADDNLATRLRAVANVKKPELAKPVLNDYLRNYIVNNPVLPPQVVDAANYLIRSLGADGLATLVMAIQEYATSSGQRLDNASSWVADNRQVVVFSDRQRREPALLPSMMIRYAALADHVATEAAVPPKDLTSPSDDIAQRFESFLRLAKLHKMTEIIQQAETVNTKLMKPSNDSSVALAIEFQNAATIAHATTANMLSVISSGMSAVLAAGLDQLRGTDKAKLLHDAIWSDEPQTIKDIAISGIIPFIGEIASTGGISSQDKLSIISDAYLLTHDHVGNRRQFVSEDQVRLLGTALNRAIGVIASNETVPIIERADALAHAFHKYHFPETTQDHITRKLAAAFKEIGAGDQEQALQMQGDFLLGIRDKSEKGVSLQVFAEELDQSDARVAARVAWKFLLAPSRGGKLGAEILAAARLRASSRMDLRSAFDAFREASIEAVSHKASSEVIRTTLDIEGQRLSQRIAAMLPNGLVRSSHVQPSEP